MVMAVGAKSLIQPERTVCYSPQPLPQCRHLTVSPGCRVKRGLFHLLPPGTQRSLQEPGRKILGPAHLFPSPALGLSLRRNKEGLERVQEVTVNTLIGDEAECWWWGDWACFTGRRRPRREGCELRG